MPKPVSLGRHIVATLWALGSLAILAAPIEKALAQRPSTPVTVVNPEASPVPTTVVNPGTSPVPTTVLIPSTSPVPTSKLDDPGRTPYQAFFGQPCGKPNDCFYTSVNVPLGHRLVIQHVAAPIVDFQSKATYVLILLEADSGLSLTSFYLPLGPDGLEAAVDQPVLLYVDGGQFFYVDVSADAPFLTGQPPLLTVTGYLLDCTVAPCAPISP